MLPLVYYIPFYPMQLSQPLQIAINAALSAAFPADAISLQMPRSNEPAGMWFVVRHSMMNGLMIFANRGHALAHDDSERPLHFCTAYSQI